MILNQFNLQFKSGGYQQAESVTKLREIQSANIINNEKLWASKLWGERSSGLKTCESWSVIYYAHNTTQHNITDMMD